MTDDAYREVAEAAWRWVLEQVRYDDGPWIPAAQTDPPAAEPPWDRDGTHSGIGGPAYVLAEIRLTRDWTDDEAALAEAITDRLHAQIGTQTDATFFDGLAGIIGVLIALDAPGADLAVARLLELATDDGWPQPGVTGPRYRDGARVNDLTLGTAGVLAGALWARRHDVPGADDLASRAADVLLAEAVRLPTGLDWPFVPERFVVEPPATRMPNLSHGLAGIAALLAVAGTELGRSDLVDAATDGAAHLVTLADTADGGFVVPRTIPSAPDMDEVTYTWCHGPTGTSLLFRALEYAGVEDVTDDSPTGWQRRCLHSVRTSGVPRRLRPGFWDNDGRCCGTAGVGEVFLDSWHHAGDDDDLAFARELGDALVERAIRVGDHATWRFLEHRNDEPLLPPGVGWMQGAAGISAYLFHLGRVAEQGADAAPLARLDSWWAL
jgi:lantibiotic modifying enzyme